MPYLRRNKSPLALVGAAAESRIARRTALSFPHVNPKADAAAAIAHAQSELDAALARLAELPSISADRLTYAAHALNNYLMVVSTISHVLRIAVRTCADAAAMDRIDSLGHATALMKQMVRQLVAPVGDEKPKLIFLPLELVAGFTALYNEYEPRAA